MKKSSSKPLPRPVRSVLSESGALLLSFFDRSWACPFAMWFDLLATVAFDWTKFTRAAPRTFFF